MGELSIEKANEILECKKGDIYIIPPYVPHSIMSKDEVTRVLSMCVDSSFINGYDMTVEKDIVLKCTDQLEKQGVIDVNHVMAFLDSLDIVVRLYKNKTNNFHKEINEANNIKGTRKKA